MCTNIDFNFKTLQWSDQLLMEQPDFIQKWISKYGFFWDIWERNFPQEPFSLGWIPRDFLRICISRIWLFLGIQPTFSPVIAAVTYLNTGKYSILPPDELRQPDTIVFDSITDDSFRRHFICHNSSTFQYRTFQGSRRFKVWDNSISKKFKRRQRIVIQWIAPSKRIWRCLKWSNFYR